MNRGVLFLLLALASVNAHSQGPPPGYHPTYVWDRAGGQGKLWLSWSADERHGFTAGYVWGYQRGFTEACLAYSEANPPAKTTLDLADSPLQKCNLRKPTYSHSAKQYEEAITSYYTKYPSDVDLPIPWLFLAFSDSEHKTAEEVHRAWTKHTHP